METLPAWARELSEKYYSRTLAMFVLHGNVHDLVPLRRGGVTEYLPLQRFLNEGLFGRRDLVLSYDRGGGLAFAKPEVQEDFARALSGYDAFHGTNLDTLLRARKIETLLVTGIATHGCVTGTSYAAQARDYHVIVVRDCVATWSEELQESALRVLGGTMTALADSSAIAGCWLR